MENDYNQLEIDSIIEELLTIHLCKLKSLEISFIENLKGRTKEPITQWQRDILIKIYDAVGEAGY